MERFRLKDDALREVVAEMALGITDGLVREGAEIACLPAWLPRPDVGRTGEAPVLDCGGTWMRAARVRLTTAGGTVIDGPAEAPLPTGDAEEFFDAQADLLGPFRRPGEPVGYCFSYPAVVSPDRDAVLVRWTKGIDIPGVEGQPVGSLLARALANGAEAGRVTVVNDTVAALMAATSLPEARDVPMIVGLVVGTGTNMASFFPRTTVGKLPRGPGEIAINLESGNLTPGCLGEVDDRLDAATRRPGRQRFEKAVSGAYVERLLDLAAADDRESVRQAILDRSADLVAAGLAGLLEVLSGRSALVLAEGGVIRRAEGYADRVVATLGRILAPGIRVRMRHLDHANLIGAAAAALSPLRKDGR